MNQIGLKIEKNNCTGCSACSNICPKNAITMKKDEYGNIYPIVDRKKCIDCGICNRICPQKQQTLIFNYPTTAYAMYIKDEKKHSESSSGGAATAFYEEILRNNGVVYGASNLFGKDEFEYVRIDNIKDLYKVKGSKYVHCYTNGIYTSVRKDLVSKKEVLFIGTPCQVAGLKSYLMKNYDNLITIDLVCHGVPSQKLLFDEIESMGIKKEDIYYISFRESNKYKIKVFDKNKKILFEKDGYFTEYLRNFLHGNINRENCYSCKYARRERISDITIGDFWGLSKDSSVYNEGVKGISLIMPSTRKGAQLVELIKNKCVIEERNLGEAFNGNNQLNHPLNINRKYSIYKKEYPKIGYKKTMKKMQTFIDKIKILLKKLLAYRR